MHDEELYLQHHAEHLAIENPPLSYQINQYRLNRIRFNDLHRRCFTRLSKLPGFTGTLLPGTRRSTSTGWCVDSSSSVDRNEVALATETTCKNNDENVAEDEVDDESGGLDTAMSLLSALED